MLGSKWKTKLEGGRLVERIVGKVGVVLGFLLLSRVKNIHNSRFSYGQQTPDKWEF